MAQIIAREFELKILNKLYESTQAEFLAIYGRRRIGKTFLIREFYSNKGVFFHLTGVKGAKVQKQLRNFTDELSRTFNTPSIKKLKDWHDAFLVLNFYVETCPGSGRIVFFFDELPWLASAKSGFLEELEYFWNRHVSNNPRVLIIVCGSAATWMIRKIVQNKGGLHGRLTATIRLMPFTLKESQDYLKSKNIILDERQILDIYMAMGGIPKYLSYIERGYSSVQNINKICFQGELIDEFNELYASLFENYHSHVNIVRALAQSNQGLTKLEISKSTGMACGGGMNTVLDDLEYSGFLLVIPNLGKIKKEIRYRLMDEYSLFYLKWIEPVKKLNIGGIGLDDNYWISIHGTPKVHIWSGYAFESICLKHIQQIKKVLGISGIVTQASGWFYRSKQEDEMGAQIDLVIDRSDNCINLCEMKFSSFPFVINKEYERKIRQRIELFKEKTRTKKHIFNTFITLYGVSKESGYNSIVDNEMTIEQLFL